MVTDRGLSSSVQPTRLHEMTDLITIESVADREAFIVLDQDRRIVVATEDRARAVAAFWYTAHQSGGWDRQGDVVTGIDMVQVNGCEVPTIFAFFHGSDPISHLFGMDEDTFLEVMHGEFGLDPLTAH